MFCRFDIYALKADLTSRMGIIMAVVAALLIHMDMAAVSSMKQSMMAGGEVPDTCRLIER